MAGPSAFSYTIVRVVPNIVRGEFVNVGVALFARQHEFLAVKIGLDEGRLNAIDPAVDLRSVESALEAIVRVADGDPDAGPIAALDQSERFGWIAAPSSTIIQTSPTHTGLCEDPKQALDDLFEDLVG